MAKDVNRRTTYTYKWNSKVGGFQPTTMTVVIDEMVDSPQALMEEPTPSEKKNQLITLPKGD